MRISKWVDMGQEVDIEVSVDDIRSALSEAFANVTNDRLGEEGPTGRDVAAALNSMARFLNALTDEHIGTLNKAQREITGQFLKNASERFRSPVPEAANA